MISGYKKIERYALKSLIMLPAIFLFLYDISNESGSINYYIFVPLAVLPFIRIGRIGKYAGWVYPTFTVAFALIILYSLMHLLGIANIGFLNIFLIYLNGDTYIAIFLGFGFIAMVEGYFSASHTGTLAGLIVSSLFFLEQFSAVVLYLNHGAVSGIILSVPSFFDAFSYVIYLEFLALYSFLVNGYQYLLPLATFSLPYHALILSLYLVSMVAFLVSLFMNGKWSSERGYNLGLSVISGSILGLVLMEIYRILGNYYFGGAFLLFALMGIIIASMATSRHSYNERINKEDFLREE
ncbi:MAG: hypothetical protein M1402_04460 [Candidatus Thermoplasmatota archaeon]|nr:hypothetical protein [Candidatus Thermoplasmatota archaeon]